MRHWQLWWHDWVLAARQDPPRLVEGTMLGLASVLCATWFVSQQWQFLLLCLNYIIGAIASILVREFITPSAHTQPIRLTAIFSLVLLLTLTHFYFTKVLHFYTGIPLF
ncbi:hypothetical protein K9N68_00880 [Kovacikia minuta CCNUW1]|uniref:hypothetical protein n=1 Tax=Kovacikia minuta TaxID=2931930 RepID=UPI001CCB848F|nr:hypothetical protein [Kovacikia minuta]UBF26600.1 hypothetical protein K9N68_00880 [Kovacikia minuta CCNUW1]